jgi:hypothetical protein
MSDWLHAAGADALPALLARYQGLQIWVVGDLMLDEYVMGAVERVSPEAPVPVVRVSDTEQRLGGAANVARQVAALGARASLAGVAGRARGCCSCARPPTSTPARCSRWPGGAPFASSGS